MALTYRPEIDGLRAIAVLSVILFHAGFSGITGGFAGVDVFFVLSGYLITSILLKDLSHGRFSLAEFYTRRVKRIFPALFTVVLVCLPVASILLQPYEYRDFVENTVAVALFLSNFRLWKETGYFAVDSHENPLLHTWSLGVEEQFYLFFPLLLLLLWAALRWRSGWVLALLALVSLALSEWGWRAVPEANFYLMPFRAWQLLAGSLCAYWLARAAPKGRDGLAGLGVMLLLGSMVWFTPATPFPSLWAGVPVLGTCLVILFARPGGVVTRLLSLAPLTMIGLISYSAYLWHQPVFAFARVWSGRDLSPAVMGALIALTLGLAWLSWRFIETPARRFSFARRSRLKTLVIAGVASLALGLFGVFQVQEVKSGRMLFTRVLYNDALINLKVERDASWNRFVGNETLADELSQFPEGDALRVLILGDSHSKDVFNALYLNADLFEGVIFRHAFWETDCLIAQDQVQTPAGAAACLETGMQNNAALLDAADHVLISARWVLYDLGAVVPALAGAFDATSVAVADNTPEYEPDSRRILRRLWADGPTRAQVDHAFFAALTPEIAAVNAHLETLATQYDFAVLDKGALLCDTAQSSCAGLTPEGQAIYYDYGHYTLAGAARVGQRMAAIGWLDPLIAPAR